MKNFFLSLFLCFISFSILAQEVESKDFISIGIGRAILGSGDIPIPKVGLDYRRKIGQYGFLAGSLNAGYSNTLGESYGDSRITQIHLDQIFSLTLLEVKVVRFSVIGGLSETYFDQVNRVYVDIIDNERIYELQSDNRFDVGVVFGPEFECIVDKASNSSIFVNGLFYGYNKGDTSIGINSGFHIVL